MGCNFGDLDNDGFLDFYLATGDPDFFSIVPNKMYRNVNGKSFEDVTYSGGFGHIQKGHAIGFGDMDMDGDQDIYVVIGGAVEGDIYTNLLFEKERKIYNTVDTGASFGGNSLMAEIGLGKAAVIKKMEIRWPHYTKPVSVFENVGVNQKIKIVEGGKIQKLDLPEISFKTKIPEHQHH